VSRPTVLVYHPEPEYARLVRAPRNRVVVHAAASPEEAAPHLAEAEILFAWRFPPRLYARMPKLRWLQAAGAGVDWALVPELPPHTVVTRAPGVFGPWMAEYVAAWCGWVSQRVETYRQAQRRHRWIGDVIPDRLLGKTLVVVGLGDIGRAIARAGRALGLRVLGVSRSGRPARGVERVYRASALRQALGQGDFVVVVVPLSPETRDLIGAAALAAMKPTAWLINVARGEVVDEGALLAVLRERRIAGAVLDVFTHEPLPARHPFWDLDNVVVTPHIAGPSTPAEITPVFNDNLARWLAGRPLRHVVDRRRGY
jgi:phosphoglycerate dehydrogenase-like enzyme